MPTTPARTQPGLESDFPANSVLQLDDLGHREKATAAFQADKESATAQDESEKAGALVSGVTRTLLRPTDFSALK